MASLSICDIFRTHTYIISDIFRMSIVIFLKLEEVRMTLRDTIKNLCKKNSISINKLETELGFAKGYISKLDKSTPNAAKLQKIADYFDVTLDYLMTGENAKNTGIILTAKDERDIAKRLEDTLQDLENSQNGLMFSGEPLDDETRELLKASLENSIRIAKINAKQKYTPRKYRK